MKANAGLPRSYKLGGGRLATLKDSSTTTSRSKINKAASLKIVLLSQISALKSDRDPVKTEAS